MHNSTTFQLKARTMLCTSLAVLLTACGGGSGTDTSETTSSEFLKSANANQGSNGYMGSTTTPTTTTSTTTTSTTTAPTTTTSTTTAPTTTTSTTTPTTTTPTTTTPTTTASVLSVGPGKQYATPCKALTAAPDSAIVEIDGSVSYSGDVCTFYGNNLTIRGVNGRPKIDAAGLNSGGKGTWVVKGKGTVIENVELLGAKVPDRNGAAIRLDGIGLTLRGSFIHDNENGILTNNDGVSDIVIENTEFGHNGYGDGQSHNLYVGAVNSLVFRNNFSHDANVGHNLKSRAKTNTILYNRFSSAAAGEANTTASGQPSYEIDLPDGGTSYVIGNVIEQPAINQNPGLLAYGMEGASNPGKDLYVVNNTFLNAGSSGTFLLIGGQVTQAALIQNNVFAGSGAITTQASAIQKTNYQALSPAFIDRQHYDLHPAAGAPFINAGSQPGTAASGFSLVPMMEYVHMTGSQARPVNGTIDIGAYEAP